MSEETWFQILPLYFNLFEFLRVDKNKNVPGIMILLLSHEYSILPKHLASSFYHPIFLTVVELHEA